MILVDLGIRGLGLAGGLQSTLALLVGRVGVLGRVDELTVLILWGSILAGVDVLDVVSGKLVDFDEHSPTGPRRRSPRLIGLIEPSTRDGRSPAARGFLIGFSSRLDRAEIVRPRDLGQG